MTFTAMCKCAHNIILLQMCKWSSQHTAKYTFANIILLQNGLYTATKDTDDICLLWFMFTADI